MFFSSTGRVASLLTFRANSLSAVLTVTVLTTSSVPGWTLVTRPRDYRIGGRWLVHLVLTLTSFKYSSYHRIQKLSRIFCKCCHRDRRLVGVEPKSGVGKLVNASLIRKWPGVRANRSLGSVDRGVSGREFRMASISMLTVLNSSNVNNFFAITCLRWCLNIFTVDSHSPRKFGESEGMNLHFMACSPRKDAVIDWCSSKLNDANNFFNSLFAPTKFVPLSDVIMCGLPRRDMSRLRAPRKPSLVMSLTTSKWTAFTTKQTNIAT